MWTRLALGFAWCVHFLPSRWRAGLGHMIGRICFVVIRPRRHVVLINLAKCFPELSSTQRHALARQHFTQLGRALMDTAVAWFGSAEQVKSLVKLEGFEQALALHNAGTPLILLCPHFIALELATTRLAIEHEAASFFSHQKDKVFDDFLIQRRTRFRPIRLVSRQDGVKPAIRAIRDRLPLVFPGDLDFGPRDAVFAPFFGVPAATITALPRLAKITRATVLAVVIEQHSATAGYTVTISAPFADFPTDSIESDVARVNAFIESRVAPIPAQYYWVHKRFKTRPPGEAKFY